LGEVVQLSHTIRKLPSQVHRVRFHLAMMLVSVLTYRFETKTTRTTPTAKKSGSAQQKKQIIGRHFSFRPSRQPSGKDAIDTDEIKVEEWVEHLENAAQPGFYCLIRKLPSQVHRVRFHLAMMLVSILTFETEKNNVYWCNTGSKRDNTVYWCNHNTLRDNTLHNVYWCNRNAIIQVRNRKKQSGRLQQQRVGAPNKKKLIGRHLQSFVRHLHYSVVINNITLFTERHLQSVVIYIIYRASFTKFHSVRPASATLKLANEKAVSLVLHHL